MAHLPQRAGAADDLLGMGEGAAIVAEGAGLLPERVAPLLDDPRAALWLVGTAAWIRHVRTTRGEGVSRATSDPARSFENLVMRDVLMAQHVRAQAEARGLSIVDVDERTSRAALGELMVDPRAGRVWLIMADATPVGYLVVTFGSSLEYGGRDAFIDELWVHERFRRQGLGTRALALAEATCREYGIRALHLEVERSNTIAQQVYRQAGFVDHDRYLLTKHLGS